MTAEPMNSSSVIRSEKATLEAFLRLVRIWNLPTALADSSAGFLIAAADPIPIAGRLPLVMLVSAAIYSAGMVWNDLLDLERDRTLHPDRPLPSGLIRKKTGGRLGGLLILGGLFAAGLLGGFTFLLAFLLVVLTFTYNGWLKHKGFAGCINMGACRFLNMWLGIAAAGGSLAVCWIYPALLGLYVAAVTLLSLQEEEHLTARQFFAFLSAVLAVVAALGILAVRAAGIPARLGLAVLAGQEGWILYAGVAAARKLRDDKPASGTVGSVIRVALASILLLDGAMLLTAGRLIGGICCTAMLVPTVLLARRLAKRPAPARAVPTA